MHIDLGRFFVEFNKLFTLYLVFPSILLLGLYFTFRLKCVQISKLKSSFLSIFKGDGKGEGNISHYQATASVLAGNFGTGNISGMAIALATGGPGALVWMWVMVFFGAIIQFANCFLGVKYRRCNDRGEFVGGPMYYLSKGLGLKKTAIIFSVCTIFAAFAVGDFVQVNSVALPLQSLGISPLISGLSIMVFVAIVVLGGVKRVAVVSSAVVPIMALLYLGAAFFVLFSFRDRVFPALELIFVSAFRPMPIVGGAVGFSVLKALATGFDRAIFATDAGTGTVPLLQSGAKTKNAVIDGVVSLLPPFLVMIVCTATALVLIVTGAYQVAGLQSTNMVTHAFRSALPGNLGLYIVLLSLALFGYTTTIAWACCLEKAVDYLFGRRLVKLFLVFYILFVPLGALLHVNLVWVIADITLTAMLVLNLIGVAGLSKEVIDEGRFFFSPKFQKSL